MNAFSKGLSALFVLMTLIGCQPKAINTSETLRTSDGKHETVTKGEVRQAVIEAGFPSELVETMVCIAFAESSYDRYAQAGYMRGLFQIRDDHSDRTDESGQTILSHGDICPGTFDYDLWDVKKNAKCAFEVYKVQKLGAWVTNGDANFNLCMRGGA